MSRSIWQYLDAVEPVLPVARTPLPRAPEPCLPGLLRRTVRTVALLTTLGTVTPVVLTAAPALDWQPKLDQPARERRTVPDWSIGETPWAGTPQGWQGLQSLPRHVRSLVGLSTGAEAPVWVTPVVATGWRPLVVDRHPPRWSPRLGTGAEDPVPVVQAAPVDLDWAAPLSLPLPVHRAQLPGTGAETAVWVAPVTVLPTGWHPLAPDRHPVRRSSIVGTGGEAPVAVPIVGRGWEPTLPTAFPRRGVLSRQTGAEQPVAVLAPVVVRGWEPCLPGPPARRARVVPGTGADHLLTVPVALAVVRGWEPCLPEPPRRGRPPVSGTGAEWVPRVVVPAAIPLSWQQPLSQPTRRLPPRERDTGAGWVARSIPVVARPLDWSPVLDQPTLRRRFVGLLTWAEIGQEIVVLPPPVPSDDVGQLVIRTRSASILLVTEAAGIVELDTTSGTIVTSHSNRTLSD